MVLCPKKPNGDGLFIYNVTDFNVTNFDYYDTYDDNDADSDSDSTTYPVWWFTPKTAPLFLVALLPVIGIRDPTYFTKFNSVGTLNVFFLIGVIIGLGSSWGLNADFTNVGSDEYIPMFKPSFPSLSGMMALGLFIHNAIITIMKNNRYQENNVSLTNILVEKFLILILNILQKRDLAAGFGLVSTTYMFIGILFYLTFPLAKECIEDVSTFE